MKPSTSGQFSYDYEALLKAIERNGSIQRDELKRQFAQSGILQDDPRAKYFLSALAKSDESLSREQFDSLQSLAPTLVEQVICNQLVIPGFSEFCHQITEIFHESAKHHGGKVADYIPQLARVHPDKFGLSLCTISGQRFSIADSEDLFSVQSCSKPITYLLALEEFGDKVHDFVGREPSGRTFNEITLNAKGLPHNPMINAGSIICCSLIHSEANSADRFDYVLERWKAAAGGMHVGFNNAVYLSERQTADRNFALGYFMREKNCFPKAVDLLQVLEFYFQCCSIELSCSTLAVVAGTLANGGNCPLTGKQIFKPDNVKNCLSLMASCGMYDFSGEFAFTVGIPAKSGVSGAIFLVIPNLMGLCIWSPKLDDLGNSVRGVDFCKRLVERFNFHTFDAMIGLQSTKTDPRKTAFESKFDGIVSFCWAAAAGDIVEMKRLIARGCRPDAADYDGRTPMHLAACENRVEALKFLIDLGLDVNPTDRWQNTPLDDARRLNHHEAAELLSQNGGKSFKDK